jgi:anti-anti-sigma factor
MSFTYDIKKTKKYTGIKLSGSLLSTSESQPLVRSLEYSGEASARFLIDLSKLNYLNSEGFNALIRILTFARNHGGEVVLVNLSQELQQLFIISKLNSIFTIVKDKKEAVALLTKE